QRNNRRPDKTEHKATHLETDSQNAARQKSGENLQRKSASCLPPAVSSETVEHFDFARHNPKEVEERGRVYRMSSSTSATAFCNGRGPFPFRTRSTSSRRRMRSRTSRRASGPPAAAQK